MNKEVTSEIKDRLAQIERERDVQVLYACESGSTMWGFASEDSDYDVRFVYARGHDHYLSFNVENKRDVIQIMEGEKDYVGFDIRKVMPLVLKSNMAMSEWFRAPYVYKDVLVTDGDYKRTDFRSKMRAFAARTFSPVAACYHFSHLARGPKHNKIATDMPLRGKQMLYALRSLLSIKYIERCATPPPLNFYKLIDDVRGMGEISSSLDRSVRRLAERKQSAAEKADKFVAPELIRKFAEEEFHRHGDNFKGVGRPVFNKQAVIDEMNDFFRTCVNSYPYTKE